MDKFTLQPIVMPRVNVTMLSAVLDRLKNWNTVRNLDAANIEIESIMAMLYSLSLTNSKPQAIPEHNRELALNMMSFAFLYIGDSYVLSELMTIPNLTFSTCDIDRTSDVAIISANLAVLRDVTIRYCQRDADSNKRLFASYIFRQLRTAGVTELWYDYTITTLNDKEIILQRTLL